jgi:hypothetical protein
LAAGVIFHNWSPSAAVIEVAGASSTAKWATRGVLKEVFGYAFGFAKCRLVVSRTSEKNLPVIRLWRAFGADEYRIPNLRAPNEAEVIHTLSPEQWGRSAFMR